MPRPTSRLRQRPALRRLDGAQQVGDAHLAEPLEPEQLLVSRASRCRRRRAPGRLRTAGSTVRSPRPSMSIAPREAKWMMRGRAGTGTAGSTQRCSASPSVRTSVRAAGTGRSSGTTTARSPSGRSGQHRADDLGDDVAGLAHDDGVAGTHVLGRDLVLVVERGHADGGAADEHRLEHGERRGPTGAADRHHDVREQRGALLGRELVGDGPPRRLRRGAEQLALARGRRPSPRRRRSRRAGRGGAPASRRQNSCTAVEVVDHADLGVHREARARARNSSVSWWLVSAGPPSTSPSW